MNSTNENVTIGLLIRVTDELHGSGIRRRIEIRSGEPITSEQMLRIIEESVAQDLDSYVQNTN